MPRHAIALLSLAFGAAGAFAQTDGDALKTPECRRALDVLQREEAAVASAVQADGRPDGERARAARARLKPFADQAARDCLKAAPDRPPPSGRLAQPPVAAPPPAALPAPAAPPPAATSRLPPLPRADLPVTLMSCDLTGCWTSDGTRLQKIGPNQLLGPRGFCNPVGGTVTCP